MTSSLKLKYSASFGQPATVIVRSPGRINIIGEHTDYNEGFVLPAAIDKAVYIAVGKRDDDTIQLHAMDFNESFNCRLNEIKPQPNHWSNYLLGVVYQLKQHGYSITGFNAVITADLPIGAGISSSAAVECAAIFALNELFELKIDKMQMVKMAQKAEHTFAGVLCGIMDQFASMMGKEHHCIKLDCRSLAYEYVPLELNDYTIVLLNTNVKHSLASSAYNTRRNECAAGVQMIQQHYPNVNSLRDVTEQMLNEHVLPFEPLIDQRCRFVVQEIERLQQACAALQKGDLKTLGQKMFATHDGLSKAYEVSCRELDYLVNAVRDNKAVLGARMMGGGFGGCTINLIHKDALKTVTTQLQQSYEKEMNLPLTAIEVIPSHGTSVI